MGNVNILDALMGMHVDTNEFENGLKKAEGAAEATTKGIASKFSVMGVTIAAIIGTIVVALEKAISTTAEFGLEMEHLSNRMGMTATQAATLVGVMERYGISAGVAARSMQIMAMEAKQTTDALDPFQTKMGRVLGTLRDMNGNALTMTQVFDLARQKVSGAATDMEKLQIAQSLVGTRMAGQLLPILKMTNAEWEKQKASVQDAMGSVEEASVAALEYKKAQGEMEQQFRAISLAIGTYLLPILTGLIEILAKVAAAFRSAFGWLSHENVTTGFLKMAEALHLVEKGTVATYQQLEKATAAAKEQAAAEAHAAEATAESEKRAGELVKLGKERVQLAEQAAKLGIGDQAGREAAVRSAVQQLAEQRKLLEEELSKLVGDNPAVAQSRYDIETKITKNKIEAAQSVAKLAQDQYRDEEAQLKAQGALNLATELDLLQRKLGDERIVGDERLKVEGEIYAKRKQLAEESMKVARDLGLASVDQEIAYRKSKAADLLGKGDVIGAGQEVVKARDLAIKQAEEQMEFMKKIRVVSLQSEIDFQKQKLEAVKGNAEQEMKVLSQIADLDKQLYDKRLEYGLTYTQNIVGQYQKIMDAAKKSGEAQTFEQAKVQSERQLVEATREAGGVLRGGGTQEQRQAAVEFAQFVNKQITEMQSLGKEVTGVWKDAASTAKDILKAASGGEEVRAPGGPSPTVGSIMSSTEGLATQGLARGSDIPRLDTSFTDLATRIRDVLLGAIPSVQSFSNAVAAAGNKIAQITGVGFNPNAALGPGGGISAGGQNQGVPLATSGSTPTPTVGPGGVPIRPSMEIGVPTLGGGANPIVDAISDLKTTLISTLVQTAEQQATTAGANAESLQEALQQVRQERAVGTAVTVSIDPNSGDLFVSSLEKQLAS
jgi:predicted 3-demethylubiquinone-9 3-methyltransferase (glyoxalase superfamily)